MQCRRFVDAGVIDALVAGEIHIGEFALEAGRCGDAAAKAVQLKEVEQVIDVFRNGIGIGRIEGDHEPHRNAVAVEALSELKQHIGAERMPDQNDRAFLSAPVLVDELGREGRPAVVVENFRSYSIRIQLFGKGVHAEREDIQKAAQQIDARFARGAAFSARGFGAAATCAG